MSGLPCDVCQEETVVVPQAIILQDDDGATAYRRYRVCINPICERYCIRRETLEQYLPDSSPPYRINTRQLQAFLPQAPPGENESPGLFTNCWDEVE